MPPEVRVCACGCGHPFRTTHPHKWYAHSSHRPKKAPHYTADERRIRAQLQRNPPSGDPCPRCGNPMTLDQWQRGQLDTGHVVDRALGGANMGLRWEHSRCGRSAGATMGNQRRRTGRTPAW